MKKTISLIFVISLLFLSVSGQKKEKTGDKFSSYKGLVMCGYQGWFNSPDDGSNRGWTHLGRGAGFKPGSCNIDLWPDVSEYEKTYKTEFKTADSSFAYIFSSANQSTTDTHFKWMKQYGIDGVFMQRFVSEIKRERGKNHFDRVLESAMNAAKKYNRAICIMYDLSGMVPGDEQVLLKDISELSLKYNLFSRKNYPTYLYHNGKPLVTVWGVGFNDKRAYGLKEAEIIVNTLKEKGFSVMLGVPTYWRELNNDTNKDPALHSLIKKCDIILPWFVGRYNEITYPPFKELVAKDIVWCKNNKVDYVPLAFPGFSWKNMKGQNTTQIARNKGSFLWKQIAGAREAGAEMLYIAMFDEMDEGTAIFKCTNNTPVGKSRFVDYEGLPSDFYLKLAGEAAKWFHGKKGYSVDIPVKVN